MDKALGVIMKSPILEFKSDKFDCTEGEDDETNPGIYGRALAAWLACQLNVSPEDVIAEDFGWCVCLKSSPHKLYIACASEDGIKDRWRVFVFAEGGFVARMFRRDTRAADVMSAYAKIKEIIEAEPGVSLTEVPSK